MEPHKAKKIMDRKGHGDIVHPCGLSGQVVLLNRRLQAFGFRRRYQCPRAVDRAQSSHDYFPGGKRGEDTHTDAPIPSQWFDYGLDQLPQPAQEAVLQKFATKEIFARQPSTARLRHERKRGRGRLFANRRFAPARHRRGDGHRESILPPRRSMLVARIRVPARTTKALALS